jgi:hypothetical protein
VPAATANPAAATVAAPTATVTRPPPSATPKETAVPDETETPQPPAASPIRTARPAPAVDQVPQAPTAAAVVGEVPADLLAKILADAAQRSGVDAAAIVVQKGVAVEWNDSSLGCPQPGIAYMQVITPGYQVVLEAGAATYDYHANARGRFILCKA